MLIVMMNSSNLKIYSIIAEQLLWQHWRYLAASLCTWRTLSDTYFKRVRLLILWDVVWHSLVHILCLGKGQGEILREHQYDMIDTVERAGYLSTCRNFVSVTDHDTIFYFCLVTEWAIDPQLFFLRGDLVSCTNAWQRN